MSGRILIVEEGECPADYMAQGLSEQNPYRRPGRGKRCFQITAVHGMSSPTPLAG